MLQLIAADQPGLIVEWDNKLSRVPLVPDAWYLIKCNPWWGGLPCTGYTAHGLRSRYRTVWESLDDCEYIPAFGRLIWSIKRARVSSHDALTNCLNIWSTSASLGLVHDMPMVKRNPSLHIDCSSINNIEKTIERTLNYPYTGNAIRHALFRHRYHLPSPLPPPLPSHNLIKHPPPHALPRNKIPDSGPRRLLDTCALSLTSPLPPHPDVLRRPICQQTSSDHREPARRTTLIGIGAPPLKHRLHPLLVHMR